MMKKKKMEPKITQLKLSQIRIAGYNPRTIDNVAFAGLTNSLRKFGCVEPIVVNVRKGKNIIIGGHQRYKALVGLYDKDYKCFCVTVDLSTGDEKLLNLSLNNPHIQGQFIDELAEYIDNLKSEIPDDTDILNLSIDKLHKEIKQQGGGVYRVEKLKPFKRTHVLLSFSPETLMKIQDNLIAIMQTEDVEYEQCSN